MSDRITLRGMRFSGRIGVGDEERTTPQPLEVDLILRLDLSLPARTDSLSDTIDYGTLFVLVRDLVEGSAFNLIEGLAGAIAHAVRSRHPDADVEVRVRKPKAPLPGAFETAEARIRRRSGDAG